MANKLSKKTPLEGSEANECTLFKIPDLTMNEPKIDRRKVLIPRNTIQDKSILFLQDYQENDKKFKPHLTIFRVKKKINDISVMMKDYQTIDFGTQTKADNFWFLWSLKIDAIYRASFGT